MIRRFAISAALLALFSTPVFAQSICHAENDGNNFNDLVSMGGPNLLLGVKFTTPACFTASAAQVFTGEGTGINTLAIWTHNASLNQPGVQLSVGAWSMSSANSWQGASFTSPVALDCNGTYWLVWGCIGGSQASVDVPGTTLGQPYRGSFDGGQSWSGPFQFSDRQWKFRLIGNCSGGIAPYCAGDGSLSTACPCNNTGATGRGCNNSFNTGGALLSAAGTTNPDTLVLTSSNELPHPLSVFLQGNGCNPAGSPFGDGLLCLSGTLKRLYIKNAVNGSTSAPDFSAGDPSITTRSATLGDPITPGSTRYYQTYYRDPDTTFCPNPPGNTWNVSSGLSVQW
jgi:hypothetical protein